MCGELLEFNEMLQRQIQRKDVVIHRMKEELINLRGPVKYLITAFYVELCSLLS